MATPKTAAVTKVEEPKSAPSAGKAVVPEPVAAKPTIAAAAAVQAPEAPAAPSASKTEEVPKVAAAKTEEAPKAAATAAPLKTEEAPKSAPAVTTVEGAVVTAVEAKSAPEASTSTSHPEETAKVVEETVKELPAAEAEANEQEAAPVEPSIPVFAEESNVVAELKAHEKKSLEEFKLRIEKAIKNNEFKAPKNKVLEATRSIEESEPLVVKESVKEVTETTNATDAAASAETSAAAATEETKDAVVEKVEEKPEEVSTAVTPTIEEKANEVQVVAATTVPQAGAESKASTTAEKSKETASAPAAVESKPPATEKQKDADSSAAAPAKVTEKAKEVVTPAAAASPPAVSAPVVEEKKVTVQDVKVTEESKEVPTTSKVPALDEKSRDLPVAAAAPTEEPVLETVTPVFVENSEAATEVAQEAPVGEEEPEDSTPPEDISLWGVPLLHTKGDKRTDVILLKFLRARDFNVNQAFKQLKKTIIWRKNFKTDTILEEEFGTDLDGVAFMHGQDREGHPVCYNVFGTLQDKELHQKTLGDSAKIAAFIRWRVQVLEKGIRLLNFTPEGPSAMVQIVDMNTGIFPKDIKSAISQAADLLQDNYPEMVVRKVFIKAPWYFNALYSIVSPFLSQRMKSKATMAPAGKTTEHLLKFISAEHIPVQYGGLSRTNDPDFSGVDAPVNETILKTGEKHSVEIPLEAGNSVIWDLTVVGYEVNYEAEFVPRAEGAYAVNIEKSRKVPSSTELPIRNSFKATEPGKVILTVDNSSKKKKIILYRYLVKTEEEAAATTASSS